jgi:hypothetical protein
VLNHLAAGAQLVASVEIGLEQAAYVVFIYIFSSFEHANLLIIGPNNTHQNV